MATSFFASRRRACGDGVAAALRGENSYQRSSSAEDHLSLHTSSEDKGPPSSQASQSLGSFAARRSLVVTKAFTAGAKEAGTLRWTVLVAPWQRDEMRCGRPGAGGGAAFVGLPASVVNAARKRATSGWTGAQPAPKKRQRPSTARAQARHEHGTDPGATLAVRALSDSANAPAGVAEVVLAEPAPSSCTMLAMQAESSLAQSAHSAVAVVAPSSELEIRPRRDMPEVKPFAIASREQALQVVLSESSREEALALLEQDMLANSSRAATESKLRLYREFHETWFGPEPFWLPLTPSSVIAVGAMLKSGRYSSGANYISAARVESRNKGHPEHPLLAHTVRKVVISIERGVGQQKQTQALPLQDRKSDVNVRF